MMYPSKTAAAGRESYLAASVQTASPAQLLVMLCERLVLDRDGVDGDHGVFVIVELEHLGRDFHADGIPSQRSRSTTTPMPPLL